VFNTVYYAVKVGFKSRVFLLSLFIYVKAINNYVPVVLMYGASQGGSKVLKA